MLKIRIIPTLLFKQFGLVKGVGFDSWRRIGPILPAIKVYSQREVDELIFSDVIAHQFQDAIDIESIKEFSKDCFVPLTIGGGINNLAQVEKVLRAGADKISVNTNAYTNPRLLSEIAKRYGTQCLVISIDVRSNESNSKWECYSHSGKVPTGHEVCDWAQQVEDLGAGEILITSIERDGTLQGYDLKLIESVASAVKIPVIASGGAGNYQHMIDAVISGGASAVAAASMFHFTEQTPAGAKAAMQKAGISIRKNFTES
jgi:imidazole glycerol-phosphate synthase subunit HisF